MDNQSDFSFDFDFGGRSREDLFAEAIDTLKAQNVPLGNAVDNPEEAKSLSPEEDAAANLLTELETHVAELGPNPTLIELTAESFTRYGWDTPKQFTDLQATHRFFWLQVPVFLSQLENMPFCKLELGIEFNPAEKQGVRRPVSVMIFPDKKIKQLAHFEQGASLKVGENFDLEVATPKVDVAAAGGKAKGDAGVNLNATGGFGLALGPFDYDLKKLELEHTDVNNSKVFWKVFTAKYLHEQRPEFVVIFQIPRDVQELKIAAAMHAYHQFDVGAAGLGQILQVVSEKVAEFFHKGAPLQDTTVWELTPKLTHA